MGQPAPLELSRSDAVERWSLRADAYRGEWDATRPLASPRFDWRSAVSGDVAKAGIAFDWQRRIAAGALEGGAFARLSRSDVRDGLREPGAVEQRLHDSAFGASLRWNGAGAVAGFPASHSLATSIRRNGRDAWAGAADERGELRAFREDRLDESIFSMDASTRVALPARIGVEAGVRYDLYRAAVASDVFARAGQVAASAVSPRLVLRAPTPYADLFLTLGRGASADARPLAAMRDPRNAAPVARLDPAATMDTIEIGFQRRLPLGIETTVSMFRARSGLELLLAGENAITEYSRPTVRQGVQLAARYEPLAWLALDFHGSALRARFADGAAEYVPGAAERFATGTASVAAPSGWTASLGLSYLGKRAAIDESVGSSLFVNARIARDLSKRTRVSLDFFNLFDRPLRDVDYFYASRLADQAEPRGVRLRLKTTF